MRAANHDRVATKKEFDDMKQLELFDAKYCNDGYWTNGDSSLSDP